MTTRYVEKIKKRNHSNKTCDIKSDKWYSCKRKMRYRSESDALHTITMIRRYRDVELDAYYCSWCNGYHLTKNIDSDRLLSEIEKETVNGR